MHYVVFDAATGSVRWRGQGDPTIQQLPDGLAIMAVPQEALIGPDVDLAVVANSVCAEIDRRAGAFRARFITDVPGQAQTYEKKEAEARRWVEGDEVVNPDRYPFMLAESAVRGVPVMQVRDEILATVAQLTPLAAQIEAHRIALKKEAVAATNLAVMGETLAFDWGALLP